MAQVPPRRHPHRTSINVPLPSYFRLFRFGPASAFPQKVRKVLTKARWCDGSTATSRRSSRRCCRSTRVSPITVFSLDCWLHSMTWLFKVALFVIPHAALLAILHSMSELIKNILIGVRQALVIWSGPDTFDRLEAVSVGTQRRCAGMRSVSSVAFAQQP